MILHLIPKSCRVSPSLYLVIRSIAHVTRNPLEWSCQRAREVSDTFRVWPVVPGCLAKVHLGIDVGQVRGREETAKIEKMEEIRGAILSFLDNFTSLQNPLSPIAFYPGLSLISPLSCKWAHTTKYSYMLWNLFRCLLIDWQVHFSPISLVFPFFFSLTTNSPDSHFTTTFVSDTSTLHP